MAELVFNGDTDKALPSTSVGQDLLAELLMHGHKVRATVKGKSMRPRIKDNQQVLLEPLGQMPLRLGEIVYLRTVQGQFVLHRLVRFLADGRIQTRGDAHWRLDDAVHLHSVMGRLQDPLAEHQRCTITRWILAKVLLGESWLHYRVFNTHK